jgi:hypothetical protein
MTGRRLAQRMMALAVAAGLAVVAVPSAQAEASDAPVRARIDRVTSTIFQSGLPGAWEGTAPAVTVSATIKGCVPGEFYVAHITMWQDGIELANTAGTSPGAGEFRCEADGTAQIREPQLGLDAAAGVPHPGRAWATLSVWLEGSPVRLASRMISVPGACTHGRGAHGTPARAGLVL